MTTKEIMSLDWNDMNIHGKLTSLKDGVNGLYIPEQILQLFADAAFEIENLKHDNNLIYEKLTKERSALKEVQAECHDLEIKLEIASKVNNSIKEIIGMLYKKTLEQFIEPMMHSDS